MAEIDPKKEMSISPEADVVFGHPTGGMEIPEDKPEVISAVRAAIAQRWHIKAELTPLAIGSTSRVWQADGVIVKLARDEADHFEAGLRAAQSVQTAGLEAGAPIPAKTGAVSTQIKIGTERWMLAVMSRVAGDPVSFPRFSAPTLGKLLAQIHTSLSQADATGAWTVDSVLDHMRRGINDQQSYSVQRMIASATDAVERWYRKVDPHQQMIRGDGPEILMRNGVIAGLIDWGGVRIGSVVDDIGCWTLHGATAQGSGKFREYTSAFVSGYITVKTLTREEEQAILLFQQLRLSSRACYVTDPRLLLSIEQWMTALNKNTD